MVALHVQEFGDPAGEVVLALHGVTAHGGRYRRLAEQALPGRRTLAVDLRGHGHSTWDAPWSIGRHVADVTDTLDAAGIDGPVDVVTHSYGGTIGLYLLAAAPGRVRRLVLLDPAIAIDGAVGSVNATGALDTSGWGSVEEAIAARVEGLPAHAFDDVRADVAEHLAAGDDGRFRFRFHPAAVVTGFGEVCLPVPTGLRPVPVLLVAADRAPFVGEGQLAAFTAEFGDLLQVLRVDSGHMVLWEVFDEVAAAVAAFLAEPAAAPAG